MAVSFIQRRFMSSALKTWAYNLSGFNQLGLMLHDVIEEDEDVTEALRRLPRAQLDERSFRLMRAMQLDLQKDILPKDQWMKVENDTMYLAPYLNEVMKEREERDEWNKTH